MINHANTKILSCTPHAPQNAIEARSKDLGTHGATRGPVSLSATLACCYCTVVDLAIDINVATLTWLTLTGPPDRETSHLLLLAKDLPAPTSFEPFLDMAQQLHFATNCNH